MPVGGDDLTRLFLWLLNQNGVALSVELSQPKHFLALRECRERLCYFLKVAPANFL
jgi:hypothetical protein